MNKKYLLILLSICVISTKPISFDFLKKLPSSFSRKIDLETEKKEYTIKPFATITVNNDIGDIHIRTEPHRSSAALQVIKRGVKGTDVSHLRVQVQATDHELNICTLNNNTGINSAMDYILVVPEQVSVQASTDSGNIIIEKVLGKVTTQTKDGNIDLYQIGNTIVAKATHQGNITIVQPAQRVEVKTKKGNIIIDDVSHSVLAATHYGFITIKSEQLKPNCALKISTHHGQINLALPKSGINAAIKAYTKRGRITSEKEITLCERTMRLNAGRWKEMQTHIEGTIGNPEAEIVLSARKGNIKITELKS